MEMQDNPRNLPAVRYDWASKELVSLVIGDGTEKKLEDTAGLHTQHLLDPYKMAEIAADNGYMGAVCMIKECDLVRFNGCWIEPSREISDYLKIHGNVTHTFCNPCFEKECAKYE